MGGARDTGEEEAVFVCGEGVGRGRKEVVFSRLFVSVFSSLSHSHSHSYWLAHGIASHRTDASRIIIATETKSQSHWHSTLNNASLCRTARIRTTPVIFCRPVYSVHLSIRFRYDSTLRSFSFYHRFFLSTIVSVSVCLSLSVHSIVLGSRT